MRSAHISLKKEHKNRIISIELNVISQRFVRALV
jgi:hypothetical protein